MSLTAFKIFSKSFIVANYKSGFMCYLIIFICVRVLYLKHILCILINSGIYMWNFLLFRHFEIGNLEAPEFSVSPYNASVWLRGRFLGSTKSTGLCSQAMGRFSMEAGPRTLHCYSKCFPYKAFSYHLA